MAGTVQKQRTSAPHVGESGWEEALDHALRRLSGDDSAARAHLAAGRPIFYAESDTPPDLTIREWPNGRRELVRLLAEGHYEIVKVLGDK
ncbi:hypothetical protein [Labrys neptuniae]